MPPAIAEFALFFGPADYFSLMVLVFVTVTAVLGRAPVRGFASLFFGMALGLVGIDLQTGQARFAMGVPSISHTTTLLVWRISTSIQFLPGEPAVSKREAGNRF